MLVQQQVIGSSSAAQLSYAYDLADRVTQVTYPSGRIVHYGYDADDNITAIRDQLNDANSLYYGYDANGRLKLTSLVAGSPAAASESYAYATGTNRLSSVTNASGTRAISYDGRGNTASESRPGSVSAATGYDGYGRLTTYSRTDVGSLGFVYNGQDDRVAMTSATSTRRFVYDPDGRVLGEYGASASDVHAEYIWAVPQVANDNEFGGDDGVGGYAPLVLATPDSGGTVVLDWVHGNHLGVPIVTTDASGNTATTPNDYLAPGFPGQSRVLADLYYNRYRDYDPSTGRYIQADPIGLAGGANDYAYAGNNPIRYSDPMGLQVAIPVPLCFAGPWGALACATVPAASCLLIPACRNAFTPKDPPAPPAPTPIPDGARRQCSPDDEGEDKCLKGWDEEFNGYCVRNFRGTARRQCQNRANDRLHACRREGGIWPPPGGPDRWSYQDTHRFRP